MAFDDRDQQVQRPVLEVDSVEEIRFVRDRSLPGVQLRISVTGQAKVGAECGAQDHQVRTPVCDRRELAGHC